MMTSSEQANAIRASARDLGLECYIDTDLDRKGMPVHVFAWRKL